MAHVFLGLRGLCQAPDPHPVFPSSASHIQRTHMAIQVPVARSKLQSRTVRSSIYLRMGLTIPPSSCFRRDLKVHSITLVGHRYPGVIFLGSSLPLPLETTGPTIALRYGCLRKRRETGHRCTTGRGLSRRSGRSAYHERVESLLGM